MSDDKTPVPPSGPVADLLRTNGVADDVIAKLLGAGATSLEILGRATAEDLTGFGVPIFTARHILASLQTPVASAPVTPELAPGALPSQSQVSDLAGQLKIDPMTLMLLFSGGGSGMDMGALIPVATIVEGYDPSRYDVIHTLMQKIQERLGGTPIVAINDDGSVNSAMTAEYVRGLERGFAPVGGSYTGSDGASYEIISVGVDAQSSYPADPLKPSLPMRENEIGHGRIPWRGVSDDVRQLVYLAVQEGEIDPDDEGAMRWLRGVIQPGVTVLALGNDLPRAHVAYKAAKRGGTLPTLRASLTASQPERGSHDGGWGPRGSDPRRSGGGYGDDDGYGRRVRF